MLYTGHFFSRLTCNQFMQRAAVTPLPPSPAAIAPAVDGPPSAKRLKTSQNENAGRSEAPTSESDTTKNDEGVRLGAYAAESMWTLSYKYDGQDGTKQQDSSSMYSAVADDASDKPWSADSGSGGRMSFGFKRKSQVRLGRAFGCKAIELVMKPELILPQ